MHELEIKLNAEIKMLKDEENKIKNIIDRLKKLMVRLVVFYGEKHRIITFHKKFISAKKLKKLEN